MNLHSQLFAEQNRNKLIDLQDDLCSFTVSSSYYPALIQQQVKQAGLIKVERSNLIQGWLACQLENKIYGELINEKNSYNPDDDYEQAQLNQIIMESEKFEPSNPILLKQLYQDLKLVLKPQQTVSDQILYSQNNKIQEQSQNNTIPKRLLKEKRKLDVASQLIKQILSKSTPIGSRFGNEDIENKKQRTMRKKIQKPYEQCFNHPRELISITNILIQQFFIPFINLSQFLPQDQKYHPAFFNLLKTFTNLLLPHLKKMISSKKIQQILHQMQPQTLQFTLLKKLTLLLLKLRQLNNSKIFNFGLTFVQQLLYALVTRLLDMAQKYPIQSKILSTVTSLSAVCLQNKHLQKHQFKQIVGQYLGILRKIPQFQLNQQYGKTLFQKNISFGIQIINFNEVIQFLTFLYQFLKFHSNLGHTINPQDIFKGNNQIFKNMMVNFDFLDLCINISQAHPFQVFLNEIEQDRKKRPDYYSNRNENRIINPLEVVLQAELKYITIVAKVFSTIISMLEIAQTQTIDIKLKGFCSIFSLRMITCSTMRQIRERMMTVNQENQKKDKQFADRVRQQKYHSTWTYPSRAWAHGPQRTQIAGYQLCRQFEINIALGSILRMLTTMIMSRMLIDNYLTKTIENTHYFQMFKGSFGNRYQVAQQYIQKESLLSFVQRFVIQPILAVLSNKHISVSTTFDFDIDRIPTNKTLNDENSPDKKQLIAESTEWMAVSEDQLNFGTYSAGRFPEPRLRQCITYNNLFQRLQTIQLLTQILSFIHASKLKLNKSELLQLLKHSIRELKPFIYIISEFLKIQLPWPVKCQIYHKNIDKMPLPQKMTIMQQNFKQFKHPITKVKIQMHQLSLDFKQLTLQHINEKCQFLAEQIIQLNLFDQVQQTSRFDFKIRNNAQNIIAVFISIPQSPITVSQQK